MRRVATVVVAMAVAVLVAAAQAVREWRYFGREALDADMLRIWGSNLGAALVATGVLATLYLVSRGRRVPMSVFVLVFPFILFASMTPVYAAVRVGVPPEWQFVCPTEAQAYAAPLAVLVASVVLPIAKLWRGV